MKLLILGLNYAPERVGIAVYTTGMAEALAAMGHEVRVIAGQPYYPAWQPMENAPGFRRGTENGVDILRVPHYVPANPTGARRLLHHLSFALAAAGPTLWRAATWQPDIVMTIAPSLLAAPVAKLAATLAGAPSWLHLQDFEVEAAFATNLFNGAAPARLARWLETRILHGFSTVSTISPPMCRRLLEKGVPPDRIVEFGNWADLTAIRPQSGPSPLRAEWGITRPHVALYAGSIGRKQDLGTVLDAARALSHRTDITVLICGEGPGRAALETRAAALPNIAFRDLQPANRLNDLLGLASVHLLPQLADAADLVMPSKLANMLASGRPIIAAARPGTGLADAIGPTGRIVPPGDGHAMATAITQLLDDPPAWQTAADAARRRAETHWNPDIILGSLETRLRALASNPAQQAATP